MTGVSLERLADTLYPKPEPRNGTAYGTVESINADGSYQVKLNASATTTRCAKLCDADVGDRVLVLIQANGHCAALGRVGGSKGVSVLFDDDDGETGNLTLPQSAADFDTMRIYFKKSSGHYGYSSLDVHQPNGKLVSMTVFEPYHTEQVTWFASRTVKINDTAVMTYDYANGSIGSSQTGGSVNEIAITRIEAW
jgi:hypothetical protein